MKLNFDNIIMVGMPGSGKSTIAQGLAKELGYAFVDGDRVIEEREKKTLKEIIAEKGNEGFFETETKALMSLNVHHTVIAPGGSICYEAEAIRHFKEIGTIFYLNVGFPELEKRLGDLKARGVVLQPGMTLKDLYDERVPLYEAMADITLYEGKGSVRETVKRAVLAVMSEVKKEEKNEGN